MLCQVEFYLLLGSNITRDSRYISTSQGRLIQWAQAQGPQASGGPQTERVIFHIVK